jgi:hypothetical protein
MALEFENGLSEEGRKPLTAAPLTPSWHAEHAPDGPAIVMGELYKRRLRERYWAGHETLII